MGAAAASIRVGTRSVNASDAPACINDGYVIVTLEIEAPADGAGALVEEIVGLGK